MRVGGQTLARVATITNSHPRLTRPLGSICTIRIALSFWHMGITADATVPLRLVDCKTRNATSLDALYFRDYVR